MRLMRKNCAGFVQIQSIEKIGRFEIQHCNEAELRQIANDASAADASSSRSGNLQGVRASTKVSRAEGREVEQ